MVRSISASLKTHVESRSTSMAWCIHIQTDEGRSAFITTHTSDLDVSGVTYLSRPLIMSKIRSESGIKPSTWTLTLAYDDTVFSRKEVTNGDLDRANVKAFIVNYNDTAQVMDVIANKVKKVEALGLNKYKVSTEGLMAVAKYNIGENYSPTCRNDFGSKECGVQVLADSLVPYHPMLLVYNKMHLTSVDAGAVAVPGFTNGDLTSPIGTGWIQDQGVTGFIDGNGMFLNGNDIYSDFTAVTTPIDSSNRTSFYQTVNVSALASGGHKFLVSFLYGSDTAPQGTDTSGYVTVSIQDDQGFNLYHKIVDLSTRYQGILLSKGVSDYIPEGAETMTVKFTTLPSGSDNMMFSNIELRSWNALTTNPLSNWVSRVDQASASAQTGDFEHYYYPSVNPTNFDGNTAFSDGVISFLPLAYPEKLTTVSQLVGLDNKIYIGNLGITPKDATLSKIKWLTGNNVGTENIIRLYDDTAFWVKFYNNTKNPVQIGDKFVVYPSCDKLVATCQVKYNNVLNFRGEPYLPGRDRG